jgi:hypothetical protein
MTPRELLDRLTTAIEVDMRLGDDDVPRVKIVGGEAMIKAAFAERDAEIWDLKMSVVAFAAPSMVQWARDMGLPEKHLYPEHYDLLERCGARMVDFTRSET